MNPLYASPFLLLILVPVLFYEVGHTATIASICGLLVCLLISEQVLPAREPGKSAQSLRVYRIIPIFYIPAQIAVIGWAVLIAGRAQLSLLAYSELALTVGVLTGVFGMLAAHEMVHSLLRWERALGTLLLTGMMYRHFRIAHVYGHHRWAATMRDATTARFDENFYVYLARTLPQQFADAVKFERRRCAKYRWRFLRNRVYQDVLVIFVLCVSVGELAGGSGLGFFLAESAVAIVVLELFNYIAHYGLERTRRPTGGFEPQCDRHSWNSSSDVANTLLLNMGRHSDHHRHPYAPYQSLCHIERAPELPFGYAGSILLALCPPLWRRVMDPLVLRVRARS